MDNLTRYWAEPVTIGEDNRVRGLGLVWYDGTPGTRNEFAPGKFEALAKDAEIVRHRDDVICCFNHDRNQVLGRESNDTLSISRTERGIAYAVLPNDADPHHQSIRQKIARKDTKGSSAHFRPLASKWSKGVLLFTKILLMEIGPVTNPAMTATIDYSEGSNRVAAAHYETQSRLAWMKGVAGEGTGAAVRGEIDRLVESGWTLVDLGPMVNRSPATLSSIRTGEIANPPETLLRALRGIKSKKA